MLHIIIRRFVGVLIFGILCVVEVFSQFPQGALIRIDSNGVKKEYDFNEKLTLDELTINYRQVGTFSIDGGGKVLIVYRGGLMQNFEYSQGTIRVNEKITIGDSTISREIVYDDGIPTVKVTNTKLQVKNDVYVDLSNLWLSLRKEKTIKELTDQMNSKDVDARLEALKVIATLGRAGSPLLIVALKDSNIIVRERAAVALGKSGDTRALKPLIASLEDKEWPVRWKVSWALGQIKGKEQIAPLKKALTKEQNEFARTSIEKTLKKIK